MRWGTEIALAEVIGAIASSGFRHIGLDQWSVARFLSAGRTCDEITDRLAESSPT